MHKEVAMAEEKKACWKCPYTGVLYELNSSELTGMGNPPGSPNTPTGMGRTAMIMAEATPTEIKNSKKK